MTTHIAPWGNSLGIRIPKLLAKKLNLLPGTQVSISEQDGKILIQKAHKYTLEELLKFGASSAQTEVDMGASVGQEEW